MEKTNDTMTICTLAQPDTVAVSAEAYKRLVAMQEHYDIFVNTLAKVIEVDMHGEPTIEWQGRDLLLTMFEIMEPAAFDEGVQRARDKKLKGCDHA